MFVCCWISRRRFLFKPCYLIQREVSGWSKQLSIRISFPFSSFDSHYKKKKSVTLSFPIIPISNPQPLSTIARTRLHALLFSPICPYYMKTIHAQRCNKKKLLHHCLISFVCWYVYVFNERYWMFRPLIFLFATYAKKYRYSVSYKVWMNDMPVCKMYKIIG